MLSLVRECPHQGMPARPPEPETVRACISRSTEQLAIESSVAAFLKVCPCFSFWTFAPSVALPSFRFMSAQVSHVPSIQDSSRFSSIQSVPFHPAALRPMLNDAHE